MQIPLVFAGAIAAVFVLTAADAPPLLPAPTPAGIVAAAPRSAWREIPPDRLVVMTLGDGSRIVIELAPQFAPVHVANIVKLARAGWFAGTSVNRVQDNYVVQWGDATERKPMPAGITADPPAEYDRGLADMAIEYRLPVADPYATAVGIAVGGWPVGAEPAADRIWLAHCYGMVGVGRNLPPDTGTGAELYVVIGQAPRHLDRNIALVGRVVEGIEALTTLPRGNGPLGFYEQAGDRVQIRGMVIAGDLPPADRPRIEVMRGDTESFRAYADARANRRDAFFVRPAGAAELCNVPVPVPVRRITE